MPLTIAPPPHSPVEPVTEVLHEVSITDPYRWLEDQNSPRTRKWIEEQKSYTRSYLDTIPERRSILGRVREFLDVETYDSLQKVGNRYFFRKRLPGTEQPCLYMRESTQGRDELLLDPTELGGDKFSALRIISVAPDSRLLLYEIKQGGEQNGSLRILDLQTRKTLPEIHSLEGLEGFAFGPGGKSFFYVRGTEIENKGQNVQVAYHHVLGTPSTCDPVIYRGGKGDWIRFTTTEEHLGIVVYHNPLDLKNVQTDFYLKEFKGDAPLKKIFRNSNGIVNPLIGADRIFALISRAGQNFKIAEIKLRGHAEGEPPFVDIIPESDLPLQNALLGRNRIFLSFLNKTRTEICEFDFSGNKLGTISASEGETLRLVGCSREANEVLLETESFTQPRAIYTYSPVTAKRTLWARTRTPFDSSKYAYSQVWYSSKDGTRIPMFLLGARDVLESGPHPTIMTAYGGFGITTTPEFSVLAALLVERGCLFALPCIRGGGEFGKEWHEAAKRHKRQKAFDDFLCGAEWLLQNKRTVPERLAIFGGSNSGLLVGVAVTQRPELFRAALCLVPILDMVRYHLFDKAKLWEEEFGTAHNPEDFPALLSYSPYHNVHSGVDYPATMIISGDADGHCNPLHARKMTARLQAANASGLPILLDYSKHRGHSPVLPLSERVQALTDRVAFLCDQLRLQARVTKGAP